jgi:chromosome partitioning protein
MGHIIGVTHQKGGTAKTTTTLNVGTNLARMGAKVLLIDIDPQANLSMGLGVNLDEAGDSVYEVLLNPDRGVTFATVTTPSGVDLVPSTLALAGAELELAGKIGRELLLREALEQASEQYDYILIDSPPNLGLFTLNTMAAAHALLVPLQLHVYAFRGMPQLEATIHLVRKMNRELKIGGIACTMADNRTNLSKSVERQVRAKYGELVFDTTIPVNIKVAEAPAAEQPISSYSPDSAGAIAYAKLTREVVARYGFQQ